MRGGKLLTGALPAAIALAAVVLFLTVGARLAGPELVRQNPNGALLAILAMGVPVHWHVASSHLLGVVSPGSFPGLAIATVVVVVATAIAGATSHRRKAGIAWFAALSALMAVVLSQQQLKMGATRVDVGAAPLLVALAAAAWATVGFTLGGLYTRTRGARPAFTGRGRWAVRAPGAAVLAGAVTFMAVGACASVPATTSASSATHATLSQTADETTSTTSADPDTTIPTAEAALRTQAIGKSSKSRATGSTAAAHSAATSDGSSAAASTTGWVPAVPGVYRYNTTGSTSSMLGNKTFPAVTTLTVDPASGTRQRSVRELVSSNGDGFVIEQVLDYRPGGIALVMQRVSVTQGGKQSVRTLNASPADLIIPWGAPTGAHRELNLTGKSLTGHQVVDVVQSVVMTVAGQAVPTAVVHSALTVTGAVTGNITLDSWWAPSARVPVKESLVGTMKQGFVSVKTTYSATIQSLTP